jgi:uncharacterized protein (DUF924 family)
MLAEANDILTFWLDEVGPKGWYHPTAALDEEIRTRFGAAWEDARGGGAQAWICSPRSSLALIVLLDQFPRNMFRGDARAFASDRRALTAAKLAIGRGHDQTVELPKRQFFYMPFMHSEVSSEQHRSVRLFGLCPGAEGDLRHARAHRCVIRRFGRFPYRNAALGRRSTPDEEAFLAEGGYTAALRRYPEPVAAQ